ncbi:MAG: cysteine desulfurase family protein [Nanoarchaeota archaeon]
MEKIIYLDNAATTFVDESIVKQINIFFTGKFGNASSQHSKGLEAKRALEESRKIIAKSINAKTEEIIFTSGGTESNNLALKGIILANPDKKHIITTKIEHDCILNACRWMEKNLGVDVTYLDVDNEGFVNPDDVRKAIRPDTAIVSIIHGNNEIGTIQDLEKIGKICREKGVYFHSDACQSYTKTIINVKKQNLDLLTLNSHKIHGPKGVGALYIRHGIKVTPLMHGGNHENGLRSGTENVSGIVGFAEAVKLAKEKHTKEMQNLRDYFIEGLLKISNTKLNGPRKNRLCNNINICFEGLDGESIGGYLDSYGVCTSVGSACSSRLHEPSHVLLAIGRSPKEASASIRFSLSRYNKKEEIDYVLEILPKIINKINKINRWFK